MMQRKGSKRIKWLLGGLCILLIVTAAVLLLRFTKVLEIRLTSPRNLPLQEAIHIRLSKPASLYVRYWKAGSSTVMRTPSTPEDTTHTVQLVLLEPGTSYKYEVVVDAFPPRSTQTASFHTREQSPWMIHNWVQESWPHDSTALGKGLALICYRKKPGYLAMVDAEGAIRWYWQDDDLGVILANLTPRGTIIALLGPPQSGQAKDAGDKTLEKLRKSPYPQRRGRRGFISGTHIVEIDLAGNELWRINLEKQPVPRIVHHDLRLDAKGRIHAIYRDLLPYDFSKIGGSGLDTLWGDGVVVMDSTGKELRTWSVWDHWDISSDPHMLDLAYDRFHFNSVNFDGQGNYLISSPILNQIWNIDSLSGAVRWKLGRGGDFKMDTAAYFSFQHAAHINPEGELMLFDNGDSSPRDTSSAGKYSRTLAFQLDTVNWKATMRMNATLPAAKYTSRMGAAYLLPNDHLLQTSSKRASILVTDQQGKILWEMRTEFLPYRAEYIPDSIWRSYFRIEK